MTSTSDYYVQDGGIESAADQFAFTPQLLVVQPDGGVANVLASIIDAGVAFIFGAPSGMSMIEIEPNRWLETPRDAIELGYTRLGRLSLGIADAGTRLHLQVSNLVPWVVNYSFFNLVGPDVSTYGYGVVQLATGATTADWTGDWAGRGLVDGSLGDRLNVLQTRYESAPFPGGGGTLLIYRAESFLQLPPFTMVNGETTTVSAPMVNVPRTQSFGIDFRRSEIAAMRPSFHPQAQLSRLEFSLQLVPYGTRKGWQAATSNEPAIFGVHGPDSDSRDLSLSVTYGNPFPPSWSLAGGPSVEVFTPHLLPNGQTTEILTVAQCLMEGAELQDGPHRFALSAPTQLLIDGVTGNQQLGGITPLVAWGVPTVGSPTHYKVQVLRVFQSGAQATVTVVGTIFTTQTTVRIPPTIMRSGERYVIRVFAVLNTGGDVTSRPYKAAAFPFCEIPAISGTLLIP